MKPYSEDLRNAAVKAYLGGLGSYAKVARIFQVHPKSLQGWVKMQKAGLPQLSRGKGHRPRVLSLSDREQISQLINDNPSITLEELRKSIGVGCSLPVYWRAVRELDLTYKKKTRCERAKAARHLERKAGMGGMAAEVQCKGCDLP